MQAGCDGVDIIFRVVVFLGPSTATGAAVWQEKLSVVVVGAPNKQTDRHRCRHLVKIVRVSLPLFRFVVSLAIFFFLSHAALYHRCCLLNEPQSRIVFAFDFEWYTQCIGTTTTIIIIYYKMFSRIRNN